MIPLFAMSKQLLRDCVDPHLAGDSVLPAGRARTTNRANKLPVYYDRNPAG